MREYSKVDPKNIKHWHQALQYVVFHLSREEVWLERLMTLQKAQSEKIQTWENLDDENVYEESILLTKTNERELALLGVPFFVGRQVMNEETVQNRTKMLQFLCDLTIK